MHELVEGWYLIRYYLLCDVSRKWNAKEINFKKSSLENYIALKIQNKFSRRNISKKNFICWLYHKSNAYIRIIFIPSSFSNPQLFYVSYVLNVFWLSSEFQCRIKWIYRRTFIVIVFLIFMLRFVKIQYITYVIRVRNAILAREIRHITANIF